ncbi:class II fructose-bisphosphate aldolase [Actinomadura chokoriensis]
MTDAVPARGRGLGAFNVIQLEHAEAIVAGAERAGAPVVLQVSENCVAYHGALAPIGQAVLAIGRAAAVPVVAHLDHATSADLVREAVDLGFGSVMFDASGLAHDANVAGTAEVTARCHAEGVWVEAELGEIGGKDGVHAPHARTDPGEAAGYAAATGVDALAVAVGTSHAMLTRDTVLDLPLIARLSAAVAVPLVLHGSSGVPDGALTAAVEHGMTKINIATRLNEAYTAAVRGRLGADPALVDPRRYNAAGRDAVAAEVARLLAVIRADGQPTAAADRSSSRVTSPSGTGESSR